MLKSRACNEYQGFQILHVRYTLPSLSITPCNSDMPLDIKYNIYLYSRRSVPNVQEVIEKHLVPVESKRIRKHMFQS